MAELNALNVPTAGVSCTGSTAIDDQWVAAIPESMLGIALSGGGIRSATFNLGLLQGLHKAGILERAHYLSTVSGGGYTGGWWSAYLKRQRNVITAAGRQPTRFPVHTPEGAETPEVRHLREFSRFLAPRWGVFTIERWLFITAVIIAAAPAIIFAASSMALALLLWRGLLGALSFSPIAGLLIVSLIATCLLLYLEIRTARTEEAQDWSLNPFGYTVSSVVAVILVTAGWHLTHPHPINNLYPALLWTGVALILIILRYLSLVGIELRFGWLTTAPLDRVIARLLALSLFWVGATGLWYAAANPHVVATAAVGAPVAVLTGLPWLKRIVTERFNRAKTGRIAERIGRVGPRLLFLVAALAAIALAASATQSIPEADYLRALAISSALVVVGVFTFRPNRAGLHAFYRSRITRAFLGASNYASRMTSNRETADQVGDDFPLSELSGLSPLQLICCAANDTGGNLLAGLYRGAQSAVLSALGLSVGQRWHPWPADPKKVVTLGAALTASGAAFNPLMGSRSIEYGASAAFVLAALNLRLGLWVGPMEGRAWYPAGYLFLCELVGYSRTNRSSYHLSDGGHFDNTGAYELLRRHCRYLIISDCGADPAIAFDDLGNLLRRAREDFGTDVDLNVKPLRDGKAHLVRGEVSYPDGTRGVVILIKPTLVGDEPADVLQYSARNSRFPHEPTGNQFYDEKQWESYRRLGELSAKKALETFGPIRSNELLDDIFSRTARRRRSRRAPAGPNEP